MKRKSHQFDFCVVGGGMAGLIAALSASRMGLKTALVHDRPVLGGNASSEIRMHICGARGLYVRETGILEELLLENHYRNPNSVYSILDSVLFGAALREKNLTLFLNCSISDLKMVELEKGGHGAYQKRIYSVTGWQMTTETWYTIQASYFADCSGDGILAPLSGAEYRIGTEARNEFQEAIAPETASKDTMGMSCLFQVREYLDEQVFIAPDWAYLFTKPEDLRGRNINLLKTNFWWLEIGGDRDSIHDTEELRDELIKIAFGVFNYIKNYSPDRDRFKNWNLDWMGFLPGKRESRRYVGDHMLNQNDLESAGIFPDTVLYGGWSMDVHYPAGFYHPERGTEFYPCPSPYGISYRTLYSRNIENLFCAGRCHSATHAALSSTRVMATTSLMGQAVGTAAALAHRYEVTPRSIGEKHIEELQDQLMEDDCMLLGYRRKISSVMKEVQIHVQGEMVSGDVRELINGYDRPTLKNKTVNGLDAREEDFGYNGLVLGKGSVVQLQFSSALELEGLRLVFDSDLNRKDAARGPSIVARNIRSFYPLNAPPWSVPEKLVQQFSVKLEYEDGEVETVFEDFKNYQRLRRIQFPSRIRSRKIKTCSVTFTESWGDPHIRVHSMEVYPVKN